MNRIKAHELRKNLIRLEREMNRIKVHEQGIVSTTLMVNRALLPKEMEGRFPLNIINLTYATSTNLIIRWTIRTIYKLPTTTKSLWR